MAMTVTELRELERFDYWQGQGLRSKDFRAQRAVDEELRWWHNRALHDAGLRSGLSVSVEDGADFVRVSCGLAYDCFGRELLLQKDREVRFPSAGEESDMTVLVIRRRAVEDDGCVCSSSDLPPDCAGPHLAEDAAVLEWKDARELRTRDGGPLAAFEFSEGGWRRRSVAEALNGAVPPKSRPLARPQLASGSTIPGQAVWEAWRWGSVPLGVQTRVDTSAAGFTKTPIYFAELTTKRSLLSSGFFPPLFHTHVAEATPDSFLLRVSQPFVPSSIGVINAPPPPDAAPSDSEVMSEPELRTIADAEPGTLLAFQSEGGSTPEGVQVLAEDPGITAVSLEAESSAAAEQPARALVVQSVLRYFLLWFPAYARQQELEVSWLACACGPSSGDASARCPGARPTPQPCGPGCGCGCGSKTKEDPCL